MRFYRQIPKQSLEALPKVMREPLERVVGEILPTLQSAVLSSVQRFGAIAVDEAVEKLGIGRFGVRLARPLTGPSVENWEAFVLSWSAASIGEASELVVRRALESFFDVRADEWFGIESLNIRWLQSISPTRVTRRDQGELPAGGSVILHWSLLEREHFRRRVLEQLEGGATESLTLSGIDAGGIAVVEIDIVIRAKARAQISARKD